MTCRTSYAFAALLVFAGGPLGAAPIDGTPVELPPTEEPTPSEPIPVPNEVPPEGIPEAAARAFAEGNIDECLTHLRASVAEDPNLPPPSVILAELYLQTGQREAARRLLEEVADDDVHHPEMFLAFGRLALVEGRLSEALLNFKEAESIDAPPGWTELHKNRLQRAVLQGRVGVAERRGNWHQAHALLVKWVAAEPEIAAVRNRLAVALFNTGKPNRAFEQFDIAHRRDNRINPPEISMAVMYLRLGQFEQAQPWYAKALRQYPEDPQVRLECATAMLYNDQAEAAASMAEQAAELGMDSVELDVTRGIIARQRQQFGEAESHLQRALARAPDHEEAHYHFVLTLAAQGEAKRAKAWNLARKQAQARPHSPLAQTALGWAGFRANDLDVSEQSLTLAAAHPQHRPEVWYFLVQLYQKQQRPAQLQQAAAQLALQLDRPGIFVERPAAREWFADLAP